jgi:hypothetical protein
VYDSYSILTVPAGAALTLTASAKLTVGAGKTLTLGASGIPANAATLALINNTSLLVLTEDGILNAANAGALVRRPYGAAVSAALHAASITAKNCVAVLTFSTRVLALCCLVIVSQRLSPIHKKASPTFAGKACALEQNQAGRLLSPLIADLIRLIVMYPAAAVSNRLPLLFNVIVPHTA